MGVLYNIGKYFILLSRVFRKPSKISLYRKQIIHEMDSLGLGSLGIITIISVFMGAVITLQTASNIDSALIPAYTVGFTARQSVILEFSPTIIALILSGIVGSNIASEIGTMRVTEQIDALEIMGINSASYIIVPKIIASMIINPFLIIWSMFISIFGGYLIALFTSTISPEAYIYGIQYDFKPFSITYALIKTVFFAFIITSVPSFYGYYVKGGALEVGSASTKGVVASSIAILVVNYVLTQILLI
ncbi:MAG: ABC transporter permease [Flavobacteriales bacterium]|nr:ABC transporter permease [Flavobacteriales bacterium]|tara:strand:- start:2006 stop:2746 length:741 start_codon:yes stop_codon:yes gene_type:complete